MKLPPQFELYYEVSRGRMGLPRVRELLNGGASIDINGSIADLPPVIVLATITLDEEIFSLLLDSGADIEATFGKARKYEMPPITADAANVAKEVGKNVAAGVVSRLLGSVPALRGLGLGRRSTGSTNVGSVASDVEDQRKRVEAFIAREQKGWSEIAGEYLDDLTPFACAVFRKDKRVHRLLIEKYPVNPNPMIHGKTLAQIIRAEGRDYLADELEKHAAEHNE